MGADVFSARPDLLGSAADEVLGWSLAEICANGPEHELVRTDRAQPSLYAVSYALWEAFAARVDHPPLGAAGHSLGEYTALAAARAFEYLDGLRLVAARGEAMAEATETVPGAMAAVMGADLEELAGIVDGQRRAGADLWIANINAPSQTVVAGSTAAIKSLAENATDVGLRRVIPLNVAGAFHTPLMEQARTQLDKALGTVEFYEPDFQVWSNLDATPAEDIPASLSGQLTNRVRFSESLEAMAGAGAQAFVHIGPGDVTAAMAKRTVRGATIITVSSLEDIDAAAATLAMS